MRRLLRRILLFSFLVALGCVLLVNGSVRLFGRGDPLLVDPRFMREKTTALWRLALHVAQHPLRPAESSPEPLLARAAARHRLPRELLLAVARVESELSPHRISHAGAMGLMQLMPATAGELGVHDPFDTRQSIEGGAAYLASLWRRYSGDRRRVVAAYNAGPGAVARVGELSVPSETIAYVHKVMRQGAAPRRRQEK